MLTRVEEPSDVSVAATVTSSSIFSPSVLRAISFPLTAGSQPSIIRTGSDKALWFTESGLGKLGRMLPAGVSTYTETALPGMTNPLGLALGADGNFYIADPTANLVAQFNPLSGKLVTFTAAAGANPTIVTLGPDNEIYFTEPGVNKLAQFRYF